MTILVHFLDRGLPVCRFSDASPSEWPKDTRWIGFRETKPNLPEGYTYCSECLRIWRAQEVRS